MDLSIVLINYRSRDPLLACLAALPAGVGALATETLEIDNASGDGSAEAAVAAHPDVRLIANRENVGYARAVNQGVAATGGSFVLVMNPDCEARPGAVQRLVEHLRSHARTALAGPRILNPDGSLEYSARGFPDALTFLFNRYSLFSRLFPNNPYSRRYLMTDWDHASTRGVDWLSGACLVARRAAIDEVGGMDEAFFMFNEDVDWCRRMHGAGWGVDYVHDAVVVHHIGASRKRTANRVILERHRGMIHYFRKHHPANPLVEALAAAAIMARAWLMVAANAFKAR
jgi:GT2 family glycosyltransferase